MTLYFNTCMKCDKSFESGHKRQKFCSVSCSSSRRGNTCKNGHEMTEDNTHLYNGYSICKACHRNNRRKWQKKNLKSVKEQTKKWREDNPERVKANSRSYYQANKSKIKQQAKEWRKRNPNKARDIQLKKYGITWEDYYLIFTEQEGLCAICGYFSDKKTLHVDHDHSTGKVRGLLCRKCNVALGMLQDDPNILKRAAAYVEDSIKGKVHD